MSALCCLILLGLLPVIYWPAVRFPPLKTDSPSSRRDDIALSAAAVLVFVAVGLTVLSSYFFIFAMPVLGFSMGAFTAGLAGRHALRYGIGTAGIYAAIVGVLVLSHDSRFDPLTVFAYALFVTFSGAAGTFPVTLIWSAKAMSESTNRPKGSA